jgi:hypothetical protein
MANSNVVAALYGATGSNLRNKILPQTLATATETEFQLGNDASVSQIAVLSMPVQTQILGSQTPSDQTLNPATLNSGFNRIGYAGKPTPAYNAQVFDNCKPFLVRVAGTYAPTSGGNSNSIAINLYLGTSKAGTLLATTGSVPNTSSTGAAFGFLLEAQLKWDSGSTAVQGQFWYSCAGTGSGYNSWAGLSNSGTAAAVSNLQFCASSKWGDTNGGTVNVSEFSITQL